MSYRANLLSLAFMLVPLVGNAANVTWPASKLLPDLDASYHECGQEFQNGSCHKFVQIFAQLLPKFDCQRPFDTAPVPALWIGNSAAFEDYVHLLSHLKSPEAIELFSSAQFRAVLDGAMAEEYVPLSLKAERALRGAAPSNQSSKRTREKPRAA
ncbi:hypothetical protein ACPPVV_18735 [Rhodanobacter sp. Col0626]|uniref:hypothetical protein n=1 Tax=Rhodanobacter sp. Col0626 TaxID=3415679 RepID=UPI003CF85EEB